MDRHFTVKRALSGLLLLAALAAPTDADAQRRRMPVRTDEIPDTESGRPAASAERPAFKGRMIIYGPQDLPVGMPPEHTRRPETEPAAEPPPAPVATPKPAPAPVQAAVPAPAPVQAAVPVPAPAPPPAPVVIVPPPPPPAPVAAPIPSASPPVRIAAPAPAPPVAVPDPVAVPVQPPAAPVAVPIPAAPPAVVIAAPAPPAPTVAVPAAPAPAVAASVPRDPVVREPIVRQPAVRTEPVRPEPARPAAPAAPPRQEVALAAPSSAAAAAAPMAIDGRLIERIFNCLSPGLPPDWKRVWVEITDQGGGREKDAIFRVSNIGHVNDEGEPIVPCNAAALTGSIVGLNEKLPADRRAWKRALLVIESDGEYELSYDYGK